MKQLIGKRLDWKGGVGWDRKGGIEQEVRGLGESEEIDK